MHLKRKIYDKMLDWKNENDGRTALLINGARRVGKSYICEEFGKNEYKSVLIVNFTDISNFVKDIFENERTDLDLFFLKLSNYYKVKLYNRKSLIIFDEVQLFPLARQSIKHFVADGRYDYIETGSLISLKQNVKDILIPSEEDEIVMHPMDFEEFLWAMGDEMTQPFLKKCFDERIPLGQALHRKVMNDFRQYMLVGGMPQAVLAYINNKDFEFADKEKKRILRLYRNDITKFANGYEGKVTAIFDSIPGQLSKKEKKYNLSAISEQARMREYENAFMWLADGMITNPCFNATDPSVGLSLSFDHTTHKLYMADTGLLVTHAFNEKSYMQNDFYRAILFDKLSINEGMLTENIVAQMLRYNGHKLYFYSRSGSADRKKSMEIDFLININNKICPIEVKSSAYRAHSSLDKFRTKFSEKIGQSYILYTKDVMIKEGVVHLPLYMAAFL